MAGDVAYKIERGQASFSENDSLSVGMHGTRAKARLQKVRGGFIVQLRLFVMARKLRGYSVCLIGVKSFENRRNLLVK